MPRFFPITGGKQALAGCAVCLTHEGPSYWARTNDRVKQAATRTLNLRQVIANGVSVRKTADALRDCETTGELCMILQKCLMPIGFDGFGFFLNHELPEHVDCFPLKQIGKSKFHFFWDSSSQSSEPNWSLTFGLQANRHRAGGVTLFRKTSRAPLLMDLNIFTSTGFSSELTQVIERLHDDWLSDEPKFDLPEFRRRSWRLEVIPSLLQCVQQLAPQFVSPITMRVIRHEARTQRLAAATIETQGLQFRAPLNTTRSESDLVTP